MSEKKPNELIHEVSPYLLQHAYNPVQWMPWGEKAFDKARKEDKMILVSIGYSACHWCHVMEHHCFESLELAELMNKHFICIKIDREERPDIDQIYMHAVQLMTGRGGWPLNCFTLPDGRPVYGGTYFPPKQWKNILLSLSETYTHEREKVLEYATKLTRGIKLSEHPFKKETTGISFEETANKIVSIWKQDFDLVEGGPNRHPKFPMPVNLQSLMQLYVLNHDEELKIHVLLTLSKMMKGGIYDHLAGGFARYSVDAEWRIPHFEKMLYDNAQLISIYSQAYSLFNDRELLKTAKETAHFCINEWLTPFNLFESALDADSENEEGKYYVWKEEELKNILGKDFSWFSEYYEVGKKGYWEEENNVLLTNYSIFEFARLKNIKPEIFNEELNSAKQKLLIERNKRIKPQKDDKIIFSWNALMISALVDLYISSGENIFLERAEKAFHSLDQMSKDKDGKWCHSFKHSKHNNVLFLEDIALFAQASLALFSVTSNTFYLDISGNLIEIAEKDYADNETPFYYFTSSVQKDLIVRKMELNDNVIPASNSIMGKVLFLYGNITGNHQYINKASEMCNYILVQATEYPHSYANWISLANWVNNEFKTLVFTGKECKKAAIKAMQLNRLQSLVCFTTQENNSVPIFKDRFKANKNYLYECIGNTCGLPEEIKIQ